MNVEFNYVHGYGTGITNDYGGIKTGSKSKNCGLHPEGCYTFIRLYNNLVRLYITMISKTYKISNQTVSHKIFLQ